MDTGITVQCAGLEELGIKSMVVMVPSGPYLCGEAHMLDGSTVLSDKFLPSDRDTAQIAAQQVASLMVAIQRKQHRLCLHRYEQLTSVKEDRK